MHSKRDEWKRLVRQWKRSGLTASDFAESRGINAGTLHHWSWRLGRETRKEATEPGVDGSFVEVLGNSVVDERFELELGGGRRLRIPVGFQKAALGRLLEVLEGSR